MGMTTPEDRLMRSEDHPTTQRGANLHPGDMISDSTAVDS